MTSNVETDKGYAARIAYDAQDDLFVGHIAGITDIIGFHAETVTDLRPPFTIRSTMTSSPAASPARIRKNRSPAT